MHHFLGLLVMWFEEGGDADPVPDHQVPQRGACERPRSSEMENRLAEGSHNLVK